MGRVARAMVECFEKYKDACKDLGGACDSFASCMCGDRNSSKLYQCMLNEKNIRIFPPCRLRKIEGLFHTKCLLDCPNYECTFESTKYTNPRWSCKKK